MCGSIAFDAHKLTLQDDHTYSTVDDTQGQMLMVSNNPAYGPITKHSKQPAQQQNDHTYSTIDNDLQEEVIASGNLEYVTSLREQVLRDNSAYSNIRWVS